MISRRIFTSLVVVSIVFTTFFIDWIFGLLVTAFIVCGLYEFFNMLEHKGISIYKYIGIGIGAIIPLSITFRFEPTKSWELLFIVISLLFLFFMQFKRTHNSGFLVGISTTIFGILYISWFCSFLIKIRYLEAGLGLVASIIVITKSADIGAFFIGSRFGRTPFVPRISPNKSVEGAIGGLVFSVLGAFAVQPLLHLSYLHLLFIGLVLGILAQLGDLSESMLKRDCQVKDSGNILPGMGGVLDIIDSLLFTAPVFYFYISAILIN